MDKLILDPIGIISTPYGDKFAVPRQPNLVSSVTGVLTLLPPYNNPDCVRGLEDFSHVWLIFQFNYIEDGKWSPTVRPPRLGGNKRVGVFASRSTHRPNSLGLSKVKLLKVECSQGVRLYLSGVDLVNGTPIFDIKPYLAFVDSEPLAQCGFAQSPPKAKFTVNFSAEALAVLNNHRQRIPNLQQVIIEVLRQDPRPAYHQQSDRIYGMFLYDFDIRWQVMSATGIKVQEIIHLKA